VADVLPAPPPGPVRAALVVLGALAVVVLGARRPEVVPDLVLPVVVAGALWSGPVRGALLGLGAGWVVDLVPPGAEVLGTGALLYAAAGLVAGAGRREGPARWGWVATVGLAAVGVAFGGRLVVAVLEGAPFAPEDWGMRLALTAVVVVAAVPLLLRLERTLAARRVA
jgi:rod shape-determining protein MreD